MDLDKNEIEKEIIAFSCRQCDTLYPIEKSVFYRGGCSFRCLDCRENVWILPIAEEEYFSVWEYFGCELIPKAGLETFPNEKIAPVINISGSISEDLGNWIQDTVSRYKIDIDEQKPAPLDSHEIRQESSEDGKEDTFSDTVEEMFHKWHIQTVLEESKSYKAFADVKAAILKGELGPTDHILSSDGQKVPLAEFIGTQDLFAKPTHPNLRTSYTHTRIKKIASKGWVRTFVKSTLFISMLLFSWWILDQGIKKINIMKGEKLVATLISQSKKVETAEIHKITAVTTESLCFFPIYYAKSISQNILGVLWKDPSNAELLSNLSQSYYEEYLSENNEERKDGAIAIAKMLSAKFPDSTASQNAWARIYWKTNKPDMAIKTLASAKQNILSHMMLAQIYLEQDLLDDATVTISDVLKQSPDFIPSLMLSVRLFSRQNKFSEAIGYQEKLTRLLPSAANKVQLIELYKKAGDYNSIIYFAEQNTQSSGSDQLHYEYIYALDKIGRNSDVTRVSLDFLKRFPSSKYKSLVEEYYNASLDKGSMVNSPASSDRPNTRRKLRRRR